MSEHIYYSPDKTIQLNGDTLLYEFHMASSVWQQDPKFRPYFCTKEAKFYFSEAGKISHRPYQNAFSQGIESLYSKFYVESKKEHVAFCFKTLVYIEMATGEIHCEWIPLEEGGLDVESVYWPSPMSFYQDKSNWYTLLPYQQGLLVPNLWPETLGDIPFQGMFGACGAYMPWFAQVRDDAAYMAICLTPDNAAYEAKHPAGANYSSVFLRYDKNLGHMTPKRCMKYVFFGEDEADYNAIAKYYRQEVKRNGHFRSLREKAQEIPSVKDLEGAFFVHMGIKTAVQEDSDMYDPDNPDKNNMLVPFAQRAEEMREIKAQGIDKLYLHLDGWAEPGYDNKHPDYREACQAAGGFEGMLDLIHTLHELGYLFGIHDQYRDYYFAGEGFDKAFACHLEDGSIPTHSRWAGGKQTYLCQVFSPVFLRRNFSTLKAKGIVPDAAYLDVFTCNEGDECFHPDHIMTRGECYSYRLECFHYLLSEGILSSSEEVNDWAIPAQIFCHYAPYDFMLRKPGSAKYGLPVPLFNLVYHDCVIIPWMMERHPGEDYMLYALLNGGAPYFIRQAAYPNIDGAFESEPLSLEEHKSRCRVVSKLHQEIAMEELIAHHFLEEDGSRQESIFADGSRVEVDFNKGIYHIEKIADEVD